MQNIIIRQVADGRDGDFFDNVRLHFSKISKSA